MVWPAGLGLADAAAVHASEDLGFVEREHLCSLIRFSRIGSKISHRDENLKAKMKFEMKEK